MKSTLLLRHLKVENANAISGLTYGFPAISHFLGFTHALSRRLEQAYGLTLGGCAVIAHSTELQSQPLGNRREQVFALTRNPLTKEGKTAPFNEEGRVHLDISLLIECDFNADGLPGVGALDQSVQILQTWFERTVPTLRLAGGTITALEQVQWRECYDETELRRLRMRLLPGFALVCRHDLLTEHHQQSIKMEPESELLDSLLDFVTLRHQAQQDDTGAVSWQQLAKPAPGYLVPLAVGYQGISPLYEPGSIPSSRDQETPFLFVESIYSLGQWVSPHRIQDLDSLLWRYRHQEPYYLCENLYVAPSLSVEEDDEEFIS
ncbi:type I-F CRISPR-associated protein Csy2 [Shewanella sedimentimangrovi]|uniref:Type I-F CRISPR-associated protein Csy2 n=1 Tax=Shewanella sedimentimangrovi TaxID=2814293 RepID=A0ABX7R186_9GAMM|nr:type I-F CRISPR-associated protein Csy2 [Shewanella sedimentimangrovi]QSX37561.1 type I-F CRISPR-associated protein Csy2 [Shewanella sedimentimangrovi]